MSIWEILGIEATQDTKAIKRAYSHKLKTIDRSSDVDGFQRLHAAYQKALDGIAAAEIPLQPGAKELSPAAAELDKLLGTFLSAESHQHSAASFVIEYRKLRQRPGFIQDMIQLGWVEDFLHRLIVLFEQRPELARYDYLDPIMQDFGFDLDIKLFNTYAVELRALQDMVMESDAFRYWETHASPLARSTLLGNGPVRFTWSLIWENGPTQIQAALHLLDRFPYLIGPHVPEERVEAWREKLGQLPGDGAKWMRNFWFWFTLIPLPLLFNARIWDLVGPFIFPLVGMLGFLYVKTSRYLFVKAFEFYHTRIKTPKSFPA